jgi:mono/diheme cytochrome c family protein
MALHARFQALRPRTKIVCGIGVGLVVAAAIGLLSLLPGRNAGVPPAAVTQSAQLGDLHVTLQLDGSAVGSRVADVLVRDAAGQPVAVRGVRLQFTMAEMDMGVVETDAQPVDTGHFRAEGPFFSMAGTWIVSATLMRDGQPPTQAPFTVVIALPGEASGPLNPLPSTAQTHAAGRVLYQANCAVCHGATGQGDGPAAAGLSPRPGDFTQHMALGKHTDGQVFLWIKEGVPGSAMPAWGQRLDDEQIWQLVTYLRTFGQAPTPQTQAAATAATEVIPSPSVGNQPKPLPPLVFVREGSIWQSDGSDALPRRLTDLDEGTYAEYPAVSPDGRQIGFVTTTQGPITETAQLPLPLPTTALYLMRADSSNIQQLWKPERGVLGRLAWSPDGNAVYVGLYDVLSAPSAPVPDRRFQVVRVDALTGERRVMVEDGRDPTFSRDGKHLAYIRWHKETASFALNIAAADGSDDRQLVGRSAFSDLSVPRFSPDGRQIVFAALGGPATDPQGYPIAARQPSALDQLLGLLAPSTAEAHGALADLWIVNSDGTGLRRLMGVREDTPMAVFSSDGQQIVIMGAGGIYLMDADGKNLQKIDPLGDHGGLDWLAVVR